MRLSGLLKMGGNKYSPIGLDMGATSIRMAQLKKTPKGWKIGDVCIKETPVPDSESGAGRKDVLIQTIKEIMKEASFSGRSVVSVMPGYQVDILPVKLTLAGDKSIEDAILKEAKTHLSYEIENAVIDYMTVENGESEPGKGRAARALLLAARREDVDEHLSILKRANLRPIALDISACALARLIGYSRTNREKNALLINAGELHTTLTILLKDTILLDRNILWGRENMVESLMQRLKLDRRKAGSLLERAGLHPRHGKEAGQEKGRNNHKNKISETVYEIVSAQLEKLAREIEKVLQYVSSEMRGAAIDVLYLTGTVAAIRDLDTYLEKRTGISTTNFNPLNIFKPGAQEVRADNNDHGFFFGVALGLAMRGFGKQNFGPDEE